jgi:hypothetical protein
MEKMRMPRPQVRINQTNARLAATKQKACASSLMHKGDGAGACPAGHCTLTHYRAVCIVPRGTTVLILA